MHSMDLLCKHKYYALLLMSKQDFVAKFSPAPESTKALLPVFVIPESMISVTKQLQHAKIACKILLEHIHTKGKRRSKPYWILVNPGYKNKGKSPRAVISALRSSERGLTLVEGIALAAQYPEVLRSHAIDLLGCTYRKDCTPTIYYWNRKTMLSAICSDVSDSMCAAPTTRN